MTQSSQPTRVEPSASPHTNGHHANEEASSPRPSKEAANRPFLDPEVKAFRVRLVIAGLLVALAFALRPFVGIRAVDPGYRYFVLEPMVGMVLFWPLSRVMCRSAGLFWGNFLSLLPAGILLWIRLFASQRDLAFGNHPNFSYGAMVFLGICSMAAYIIFGRQR
ncbi:MAG: hypothetical protein H6728_13615 [Myxococcales bacterium]|nr:hypothetical protein [Myxococcales bacterium]MCB9644108.1 hypothetical protein [Myxococcales bacterium]